MKKTLLASSLSLFLLTACGGGGGGSNTLTAATDKPKDASLCATSLVCE